MRNANVSNPCKAKKALNGDSAEPRIAKKRDASLDDVGDRAKRLHRFGPHRAVIARVRRVQRRLPLGMRGPVEIAAIDQKPAD